MGQPRGGNQESTWEDAPGFFSWCELHGRCLLVGPVVNGAGALSTSAHTTQHPAAITASLCLGLSRSCQLQVKVEVLGN